MHHQYDRYPIWYVRVTRNKAVQSRFPKYLENQYECVIQTVNSENDSFGKLILSNIIEKFNIGIYYIYNSCNNTIKNKSKRVLRQVGVSYRCNKTMKNPFFIIQYFIPLTNL